MKRDILKKALAGSTGHRNSSVLMAYQGGSNATNWPARIITSRKIGTLESMEGWSVTK
jgi:hypothetical protein